MLLRGSRLVGVAGLLAALCFLVAFLLDPTPPGAGASGSEVLAHVAQYQNSDRAAAFLFGLSAALLITFLSGLRAHMSEADERSSWAPTAMIAGGVVAAVMLISTSAFFFTLASQGTSIAPGLAAVLSDAINYGFVFTGFGVIVFVPSAATLMLHRQGAWRWLGRLGFVVAVLQIPYLDTAFFTSGAMRAGGIVTIVGFAAVGVWIVAVSAVLLVSRASVATAAR
jgi:hypothetical protein